MAAQSKRQLLNVKHNPIILLGIVAVCIGIGLYLILRSQAATSSFPTSRNMYKWPFSRFSIWNMPIGTNADIVPANFPEFLSVNGEENIVILDPNAPVRSVYQSAKNGWEFPNADRCEKTGGTLISNVLIPDSYNGTGPDGLTYVWLKGNTPVTTNEEAEVEAPNGAGAILRPDKRTIVQTQPLVACGSGQNVTSHWYGDGALEDDLIDGDGEIGAQGGSRMSSIGGTLRMGELTKTSGPVFHALKMTVNAPNTLFFDEAANRGWRWPARTHDSYANKQTYGGTNPELKQGALLALPSSLNLDSLDLQTEPGRMIAWTVKHYGIYVVDDAACSCANIAVEHGPDGKFMKAFEQEWGFPFRAVGNGSAANPWKQDLDKIFANIGIVKNNEPNAVGGGGDPLVCYAPKMDGESQSNPNGSRTEPADCGLGGSPTPTPTDTPTVAPTPTISPTPLPSGTPNPGDIDGDTHVNFRDLSILIRNYKKSVSSRAEGDLDGDGTVTILDLSRLVKYWGT